MQIMKELIISYIIERGNPFGISVTVMRNIASGKKLDDELVTFKANCLATEKDEYQKFKDEKLEKVMKLFDPII